MKGRSLIQKAAAILVLIAAGEARPEERYEYRFAFGTVCG